jgi:outer membrane protein assembly factor BamB
VASWKPPAGDLAGALGPAFAPDGTLFVTTNKGLLVALDGKTLAQKGSYNSGGEFVSSAMVFPYKDKILVAAAASDGSVHILDAGELALGDAKAIIKGPTYSANSGMSNLSTWQGPDGTRWILAATNTAPGTGSGFTPNNGAITNGTIAAWRLSDESGALRLTPAWTSRDMKSPLTPMIINGVAFAVSSGEFRTVDPKISADQIARRSSPAVLYALDLQTGASIWDSGKLMTSFAHSGALSGGASQLYIQTYDQTVYAFGFPIEH